MKKAIFLVLAVIGMTTVFAQTTPPLEFKVAKWDFKKVTQHKPVTYNFQFKNVSDKPVVIETATAECGCTTPEYPKTPIAKGATNNIKVTYNAEAPGSFTKRVTVKVANTTEPVILTITGEVVNAPAKAAELKSTGKAAGKPATAKPAAKG
jgi:hypothetical protein